MGILRPRRILNKHHLLLDNQYYHTAYKKTAMCLHHTSGRTAKSSIDWWNKEINHVCTPIIIPRNGEIWELFPAEFWAYALGRTNYGSRLERRTIHLEIASAGGLTKTNGTYKSWFGEIIPKKDVITYKNPHREFYHFERYTDAQVGAIVYALDFYTKEYNIKINPEKLYQFWWKGKEPKGIYSHTTVRRDKSDIHPQPNLIKAIYKHFGCNKSVTE